MEDMSKHDYELAEINDLVREKPGSTSYEISSRIGECWTQLLELTNSGELYYTVYKDRTQFWPHNYSALAHPRGAQVFIGPSPKSRLVDQYAKRKDPTR